MSGFLLRRRPPAPTYNPMASGPSLPPAGWVDRWRRSDPSALAWLREAYGQPIGAYLRRIVGDRADAEDLVQDFLLQALRAGPRYDPDRPLAPWLYAIAHRMAIDHLRRRRLRTLLPWGARSERPPAPPGEAEERADLLDAAMGDLSLAFREVLVLRHFQGLSFAEMEEALQVPSGTLRWRHAEALAALGRAVRARDGSGDA